MSMKEIDLFIDESGNPGRGRGRYFTNIWARSQWF